MDKIKTLLFGMTGLGNSALKALSEISSVELIGILTVPRPNAPFPYYECEQLHDVAKVMGIPLYEVTNLKEDGTHSLIKEISPDMIVVSTFNQIITKNIMSVTRLGVINIHPSLLPKYRGATPTVWALMEGAEETGVTAHFIDDERIDSGRIISQARLKIESMDTDGSLRFKLAGLSEKVLQDAIYLVTTGEKEIFSLQDESKATYYPKRTLKDAEIDINKSFGDILNKIRAMYPYPGAYIEYGGMRRTVIGVSFPNREKFMINANIQSTEVMIDTAEGKVKFYIMSGENEKRN